MLLRRRTVSTITPADAAAGLHAGDLQLVDVRETREVDDARVAGATHIPLQQLPSRLAELDRTRRVAFLCRSGHRSAFATRIAARAGVDAANVEGGVTAWRRAGLPCSTAGNGGVA